MPRVCPECGKKFADHVANCPDDRTTTWVLGTPDEEVIGQKIDGRFTIQRLLGRGGMGAVYLATQHSMNRDVALKVLLRDLVRDEVAVKRFFREAQAVSRLTSPHTITVFDFGQTPEGLMYIAMELLRGRSIARLLQDEGGRLPWRRAVQLLDQIMESLTEAHSVGIVHRDLKPENVFMLEGAGRQDFVKVLDFGIAKLAGVDGTALTRAGAVFGTPMYMSPEQGKGLELDGRSDLYSAGVMLFEMLVGRLPIEGDTPFSILMKKVTEPAPTPFEVDPALDCPKSLALLVRTLLAREPDARPPEAAEVRRLLASIALEPAGQSLPVPTLPTLAGPIDAQDDDPGPSQGRGWTGVFPPDAPRFGKRFRRLVLGFAVVAAGALGVALLEPGPADEPAGAVRPEEPLPAAQGRPDATTADAPEVPATTVQGPAAQVASPEVAAPSRTRRDVRPPRKLPGGDDDLLRKLKSGDGSVKDGLRLKQGGQR